MQKFRLIAWCESATSLIRFGPDRKTVYQELMDHLQERRDAFMEQGFDEKEATTKALDAMGDAKELAPKLAAIHRPFWGYFLRVARILLVILLVLSLKPIRDYAKDLRFSDKPAWSSFDYFDAASYTGDSGKTLLQLAQPEVSFSSDGNTFTLTDAVLYTTRFEKNQTDRTCLHVLIRQKSFLPWTENDGYFHFFSITSWFFARDNLGNIYKGYMGQTPSDGPILYSHSVQSGLFTGTHECWINDLSPDAQWVEICYQRDGRDFALRIDLTGGGAK